MAATPVGFLTRFSEFAGTPLAQIEAALADAESRVSETFGSLREQAIYLEAADALASSTAGRNARRVKDVPGSSGTVYFQKLQDLRKAHALKHRVTGRRRGRLGG